jgi:DNA polymerase III subunit delta
VSAAERSGPGHEQGPGRAPAGRSSAKRDTPVWLLLGPEEGEKAAFIAKVKVDLTAKHGEPEVTRFYAGESRMAQVVMCLRNQTLFSRHRLVILSDAEKVHLAEEAATLVEYVGDPAPDATLLLVSAGFAGEMDKRVTAAVPKEGQKIFWEMFDNQKQGWIANFFRQRKITIEPEAAEYILDMVENNTRDMRVECERLAQFFGAEPAETHGADVTPGAAEGATQAPLAQSAEYRGAITLESVERYIYHSKEENVFTLFDRICEGDLAASVEVLDKILLAREAEATQLATGLLSQFRKLAGLKRMLAESYQSAEAFPKLRIFSKKNQRTYLEGTRKYSAEDIERIVTLLAAFDERFRSIKSDLHALLLHLLVYYIVRKAGHGAWRQFL